MCVRPAHIFECLINCHSKLIDPQTAPCSASNIQRVALFQSLSDLIRHVDRVFRNIYARLGRDTLHLCHREVKRTSGVIETYNLSKEATFFSFQLQFLSFVMFCCCCFPSSLPSFALLAIPPSYFSRVCAESVTLALLVGRACQRSRGWRRPVRSEGPTSAPGFSESQREIGLAPEALMASSSDNMTRLFDHQEAQSR